MLDVVGAGSCDCLLANALACHPEDLLEYKSREDCEYAVASL